MKVYIYNPLTPFLFYNSLFLLSTLPFTLFQIGYTKGVGGITTSVFVLDSVGWAAGMMKIDCSVGSRVCV